MIPLIGILLCVYLVFKGFEIFQIAYCSPQLKVGGIVIGIVAVIASIVIAAVFAYMFLASSLPTLPTL